MRRIFHVFVPLLLMSACGDHPGAEKQDGIALSKAMGTQAADGFARAVEPRPFVFPADHGPHPAFRTEWWYVTGNLRSSDGEEFGFQFTIFRTALTPRPPTRAGAWRTNQIYMGHVAVTDGADGAHYYAERFSREGNGLAGAEADPFNVWLEDWRLAEEGPGRFGLPALRLTAATGDFDLSLRLEAAKPVVLQGDRGLSQKGSEPGNASYYYSYTRLSADGRVRTGSREADVRGEAWMDREWSTSALGDQQVGWDWFSLQLDDSTEVMYYRLRQRDGQTADQTSGVLVLKDGTPVRLSTASVDLSPDDTWTSPTGSVYPSGWRLQIAERGLDLRITPIMREQLMEVSIEYWEGAVRVVGTKESSPIQGRGYVELTGYDS